MGVGRQRLAPGALHPGKTRCPLYKEAVYESKFTFNYVFKQFALKLSGSGTQLPKQTFILHTTHSYNYCLLSAVQRTKLRNVELQIPEIAVCFVW